ncbi:hypothetical protein HAZT_HAZT007059 [Hyalella azteca]|uniref:EF-hand domain-containing protein n=1 Tax=Hyalella azteca TaxID=294128 RepID=A0A6A0GW89_HYAAZ|nr:hypothetical protein HAZT_HAZT007059 [Hyalella azteca]
MVFCCAENDTEDVELNVVRYKVDGIETLARTTKFTKKELQLMYRGFKAIAIVGCIKIQHCCDDDEYLCPQECPNGMVSEDTFKGIYSQFFPQGDATAYAHYVFNTFDTDHNGSISFENFVTILSELSRGSTTEKLRWAFTLYDINGDGYISKQELMDIVGAVYSLLGRNATPTVDEATTRKHVDRIFEKMDINGDGVVTLDEFMEICLSDETIANSMTILDTAFNVELPHAPATTSPHASPCNDHRHNPTLYHHHHHHPYHPHLTQPLAHGTPPPPPHCTDTPGVSFSPLLCHPHHYHPSGTTAAGTCVSPPSPLLSAPGVHRSPLHHRSMPGDRRELLRDYACLL